jgi:hypothetical protein
MNKLMIVWKSDNEIDIHNFIVPYAYNAIKQEWFDQVEMIIWGASQEVVANNSVIQQRVKNLIKNGIDVYACKMCADNINVSLVLSELGVNVKYTGDLLSDRLKDKSCEVITL